MLKNNNDRFYQELLNNSIKNFTNEHYDEKDRQQIMDLYINRTNPLPSLLNCSNNKSMYIDESNEVSNDILNANEYIKKKIEKYKKEIDEQYKERESEERDNNLNYNNQIDEQYEERESAERDNNQNMSNLKNLTQLYQLNPTKNDVNKVRQ